MSSKRGQNSSSEILISALWYAEHGFPVFPTYSAKNGRCCCWRGSECEHPGKHPATKHGFKEATTDKTIIESWWKKRPNANIAIPTGALSGFMVVDVDPRNGGNISLDQLIEKQGALPATARQSTGGGGTHFFFRNVAVKLPAGLAQGIDLKGEGGYVIVEPSLHVSGGSYTWDAPGRDALLTPAEPPPWLIELILNAARTEEEVRNSGSFTIGGRNNHLASIAGALRRQNCAVEVIETALHAENLSKCDPPLPDAEVLSIARSVAKYPAKKPAPLDLLLELTAEFSLCRSQDGRPHALVRLGPRTDAFTLETTQFADLLIARFYQKHRRHPGNSLREAVSILSVQARSSAKIEIFVRSAEHQGLVYLDLANERGEVVEIDRNDWQIITDPPVQFRRPDSMHEISTPLRGGAITELRDYVNLGSDFDWVLCISWLLGTLRGKGPYPILILQGEQGTAKSTLIKFLKSLVDPSMAPVRTLPKDTRDLFISATTSWISAYDNLSEIPSSLADAFCGLATGHGFSVRKLFSDDREFLFEATRPIILSGIEQLARRSDLADRALILNLPPIDETRRRGETELFLRFKQRQPFMLGAILTALSSALKRLPDVHLNCKPRLADFAMLGTAAEACLGFPAGMFLDVLTSNRQEAVWETLEGDLLVISMDRLARQGVWKGTCSELLQALNSALNGRQPRGWPQTPRGLSDQLRRLAPSLRRSPIEIAFLPRGAQGKRLLTVSLRDDPTTVSSVTSRHGTEKSYANLLNGKVKESKPRSNGVKVKPSPATALPSPSPARQVSDFQKPAVGNESQVTKVTVDPFNQNLNESEVETFEL